MKKNNKTFLKIFLSFFFIFTAIIFLIFSRHTIDVEVDYCEDIGKKLKSLHLNQFQCNIIKYGDTIKNINFSFCLKNYDDYDAYECCEDIVKVRNLITNYLHQNPTNDMNNNLISFQFQTLPGDSICMKNYNDNQFVVSSEFLYFSYLYIPISSANEFWDAKVIGLRVDEKEELALLKKWKNLEKIYLTKKNFTEEEKEYLLNIIPNCTIICNGEIINGDL